MHFNFLDADEIAESGISGDFGAEIFLSKQTVMGHGVMGSWRLGDFFWKKLYYNL